jgi:hypothetical protein
LAALLALITWLAAFFGAMKAGYRYGYQNGQSQLAAERMVVRSYPFDDLLAAGPQGVYSQQASLIDLITSTVSPASWDKVGGRGTVAVMQGPPACLIITQSEAVHPQIGALLKQLRRPQAQSLSNSPPADIPDP